MAVGRAVWHRPAPAMLLFLTPVSNGRKRLNAGQVNQDTRHRGPRGAAPGGTARAAGKNSRKRGHGPNAPGSSPG